MHFHLNVYSGALGLATSLIFVVGLVAWRNRDQRGSLPFVVLLFGIGLWTLGNAFQLAAIDLEFKVAFRTLAYVGHNITPIAMLVFAGTYAGKGSWFTRRRIALLAAEPMAVALLLTPTNALGLHSLVWTDLGLGQFGPIVVLSRSFGPVYWVNTAYNYVLVVSAVALFAGVIFGARETGRRQASVLLVASVPPFVTNVLWVLGETPIDFTPFAFVITGIGFAVALYRYQLFEVVPIVHESILDAIRDGYVVVDESGRVLDLNEAARERMIVHDDPIDLPLATVLPEVADVLDEGKTEPDMEIELQRSGGPRYIDVRVSPLEGRRGRLILLRDVTEAREVERRYRRLIENATDLVTVLDESGTFRYASPSAERILDRDPETLVGTDSFEPIHPEDREAVKREFQQALEDPEYIPSIEYRYRRGDGTWIWLSSRGRNRFDDPYVEGFVVNSRDVTQRRHRERVLEQQNERLDEFTGAVSHDLRNPLNVISGRLQLARETGEPEHFEKMAGAVERMETLIEGLLELARTGRLVGDPETIDLAEAVEAAWDHLDTETARLRIREELGTLSADRDRLYQLLENLFRNAMEHGGAETTIEVGTVPNGFYVSDDGPGIPPDVREAVFERGFSTDTEGTGFGLSIVRSITSAHGWDIDIVESELGGARFEITGIERTTKLPDTDEGE